LVAIKKRKCNIGLDISTTCLGICVVAEDTNEIVYKKALNLAKYEHRDKKKPVDEEFREISRQFDVQKVCIEAPLFMRGKTSADTITKLFFFNGWVSCFAYQNFKTYPRYVDLNKARRKHGLRVPSKEVTKENSSKKKVFDFLIGLGYNLEEERTRSGNVRAGSYDISDAAFALFIGSSEDDQDCWSISEFVNKHYMTILVIGLFLSLFLVKCDGSVDINIGGL